MRQLFGTDGIRGVAGEYPLDPLTAHALGMALGDIAAGLSAAPEVILGIDTRESGPWLAGQVAGGLARRSVPARFAGVITTPGIAHLARTGPFAAGVMISASHNLYQDNGIKLFSHSGYKFPDEQERRIEQAIFAFRDGGLDPAPRALTLEAGLEEQYLDHLAAAVSCSVAGLRVVLDCAHGSAWRLAPLLFERLGVRALPLSCAPDGRNINRDCGALHPEAARQKVLEEGADAGIAFDGDADRAIFISRAGRILDGDAVLLLAARSLLAQGRLSGPEGKPTVVATVMSNLGLEHALAAHGIRLLRTPVGDKYVLEGMLRTGAVLGGEQSGHVIFLEDATTGDGLLTALRILGIMVESGRGLDELAGELQVYPQRLLNVPVRTRKPLADLPAVAAQVRAAEQAFGRAGRVLVRFSGTEPVARVMVEGLEAAQVDAFAASIAEAIQRELGE